MRGLELPLRMSCAIAAIACCIAAPCALGESIVDEWSTIKAPPPPR